jgi:hypothetical protein
MIAFVVGIIVTNIIWAIVVVGIVGNIINKK